MFARLRSRLQSCPPYLARAMSFISEPPVDPSAPFTSVDSTKLCMSSFFFLFYAR